MTKCPVCEMPVEDDEMPVSSEYKGKQYYFCSTGCREEFEYDQEKYLKNLILDEETPSEDFENTDETETAGGF